MKITVNGIESYIADEIDISLILDETDKKNKGIKIDIFRQDGQMPRSSLIFSLDTAESFVNTVSSAIKKCKESLIHEPSSDVSSH